MAFEKMTAEALYDEFVALFPDVLEHGLEQGNIVTNFYKIGARMLRIEFSDGPALYFLWYDENNWNLGTKMYRNKPKSQETRDKDKEIMVRAIMNIIQDNMYQAEKDLESSNIFTKLKDDIEHPKPVPYIWDLDNPVCPRGEEYRKSIEQNTNSNEVITGCNQMSTAERAELVKDHPEKDVLKDLCGTIGVEVAQEWVKEFPDNVPEGCVHVMVPRGNTKSEGTMEETLRGEEARRMRIEEFNRKYRETSFA